MDLNIMNFSDCLMLKILRYLDSSSLYSLSQVNLRLENLLLDSSLWINIDARNRPHLPGKSEYCLERIQKLTKSLLLKWIKEQEPSLPTSILSTSFANRSENLSILALEHSLFDAAHIKLLDFPENLVELSLRYSQFVASGAFFKKSFSKMNNLKVLLLDGCKNVYSSVILSLSKFESLEILSLCNCNIDSVIAYFSLAGVHGFKKIKVIDARLSGLGDTFLKSICRSKSLLAIYYQNLDLNYVIEFRQSLGYLDENCNTVPKIKFGTSRRGHLNSNKVTDKGIGEYVSINNDNSVQEMPNSFLYKDPYQSCKCGYDKQDNFKGIDRATKSDNLSAFVDKLKEIENEQRTKDQNRNSTSPDRIERSVRVKGKFSLNPKHFDELHMLRLLQRNHKFPIGEPGKPWGEATTDGASTSRTVYRKRKPAMGYEICESKRRKIDVPNSNEPNSCQSDSEDTSNSESDDYGYSVNVASSHIVVDLSHRMADNPNPPADGQVRRFPYRGLRFGEVVIARPEVRYNVPLRRISFRSFPDVTDRALCHIAQMNLELLDVTNTSVTENGVKKFLENNPNCRVLHESYCKCTPGLYF